MKLVQTKKMRTFHVRSVAGRIGLAAAVFGLAILSAGRATADVKIVGGFDSSYTANGSWFVSAQQTGGTASVVGATPESPPFSPGAALLTTTNNNSSKTQVSVVDAYGAASNLASSSFGAQYAYYKAVSGGLDPNAAAAPALKLTVSDGANGITFVYEPYYQPPYSNPTPNHWNTETISASQGLFWTASPQGNGFGLTEQAGGGYAGNQTLAQWVAQIQGSSYASAFANAALAAVSLGIGSYNNGQTGYVDYVTITGTSIGTGSGALSRTYDFQPVPVPEPSTLAIAGLGALGFLGYGWKRRARNS